jgi:TRAP-type mannitol/chloroaromatic compound transport system substrate-binding protein
VLCSTGSRRSIPQRAPLAPEANQALSRLRPEFKSQVQILSFPPDLLEELRKLAVEVVKEESEKSPMAEKVHASYLTFEALIGDWARTSEARYHDAIAGGGASAAELTLASRRCYDPR